MYKQICRSTICMKAHKKRCEGSQIYFRGLGNLSASPRNVECERLQCQIYPTRRYAAKATNDTDKFFLAAKNYYLRLYCINLQQTRSFLR